MKKYLIILIGVLLTAFAFSEDSTQVRIDGFAEITFPGNPERSEEEGGLMYSFQDSSIFYLLTYKDLRENKNFRITREQLPDLYEGFIRGALDLSEGRLIDEKEIKVGGLYGREYLYSSQKEPGFPGFRLKRVLFVNGRMFNFEAWTFSEPSEGNYPEVWKFMNSFEITSPEELVQYNTVSGDQGQSTDGFKSKAIMVILILVGLSGLILFARFFLKKKL